MLIAFLFAMERIHHRERNGMTSTNLQTEPCNFYMYTVGLHGEIKEGGIHV